jgi:hypothetical protein
MDPVAIMLVPGLLGGLVVAFVIWLRQRRSGAASSDVFLRTRLSTDVINMASIRVAGVGGLGLVAMAVAVALNVQRIGQTLAIGLVLGVALAAILIVARRWAGPMPSSGRHGGANSVLAIDDRPPTDEAIPATPSHGPLRAGGHLAGHAPQPA